MIEYKRKQTKKDKILWELYMAKVKYRIFYWDFLDNLRKKFYCDRGFHKTQHSGRSISNSKGVSKEVQYLQCKICKTIFFAKAEDKIMYKKIDEGFNDIFTSAMRTIVEDNDGKTKALMKYGKTKSND